MLHNSTSLALAFPKTMRFYRYLSAGGLVNCCPPSVLRTLSRDLSEPKMLAISVYISINSIIWAPKVSYRGTVVTPSRLQAMSVTIHSSQFTEVIPATLSLRGYSMFHSLPIKL